MNPVGERLMTLKVRDDLSVLGYDPDCLNKVNDMSKRIHAGMFTMIVMNLSGVRSTLDEPSNKYSLFNLINRMFNR